MFDSELRPGFHHLDKALLFDDPIEFDSGESLDVLGESIDFEGVVEWGEQALQVGRKCSAARPAGATTPKRMSP